MLLSIVESNTVLLRHIFSAVLNIFPSLPLAVVSSNHSGISSPYRSCRTPVLQLPYGRTPIGIRPYRKWCTVMKRHFVDGKKPHEVRRDIPWYVSTRWIRVPSPPKGALTLCSS